MPRVKIDYIVSLSSEDTDNPASNLLSWEVNKKRWLCAKSETSCSVVLQLAKAVKISAINIGAYNTAFVEVLVGRSEKPNEPFQVLVPSSVFLSPGDSRRAGDGAAGIERVRSFNDLGPLAAQRWDRVRVVCTQPYNKHCKFGLSFIQISEPEGSDTTPATSNPALLRLSPAPDSSSDDDAFRPGELFAAVRNSQNSDNTTDSGSQIRHATSQALKNISDSATKLVKTPISKNKQTASATTGDYGANRQRDDLMYNDDDDRPHAKIDHIVQRHKDQNAKNEESKKKRKDKTPEREPSSSKKIKHNDDESKNSDTSFKNAKKDTTPHNKRKKDCEDDSSGSKRIKNEKQDTTKNTTDDGFRKENKNDRSDRSKDEPSTSRKADHNQNRASSSSSTAVNTSHKKRPRKKTERDLSSVLSGVVLSLSGYVNPERGALRQLALDMGARVQRDWGPTCNLLVCAFPNTPKLKQVRAQPGPLIPIVTAEFLKDAYAKRKKPDWKVYAVEPKHRVSQPDPDSESDGTDVEYPDDEECDTDDEIDKVRNSVKNTLSAIPTAPSDDDEGGDTDQESEAPCIERIDPSRSLPALFEGRTFLIAGAGTDDARREWTRYVRAYGGLVLQESEVDDDSAVDYVLSADGKTSHKDSTPVRPHWLWQCHRQQQLLPAR